jgi:predicted lipid-binding transport protein (Tim44 family)
MHSLAGTISSGAPLLRGLRSLAAFATLALALLVWTEDADARVEGSSRIGTSGVAVFESPPAAAIAPNVPVALDHPMMPQTGQPAYPGGSLGGLFNRPGMRGGFAAGFLGAGLLGLMFGRGMFSGLGGEASYWGLMFQLVLVLLLGRVIWTWWYGYKAPLSAALSPRQLADAYERSRGELRPGGGLPAFADLEIVDSDYECFERLLKEIRTAYGREDLEALRMLVTPGMMSYFSKHPALNAVSGGKLRKGDLTEAWSEGDTDYATVALRSSPLDRMRIAETWTFMRTPSHCWLLSAIQQA